jgi:hypothetical protein
VYTIVFIQQNLLSLCQQKLGGFWEFLFSVNSTHFSILFWNATPNFQYRKIEKKEIREKKTLVFTCTLLVRMKNRKYENNLGLNCFDTK